MPGHYQHIVFDLDETLLNTKDAVLRTWERTLSDYGFRVPSDRLNCVLGVTTEAGLAALGYKATPGFAEKWVENYGLFCQDTCFFDGIPETLSHLRKTGFSLGVVSSRPRSEYDKYFPAFQLDRFIGKTVLADDTERHKPDPEPLLRYFEMTKTEPSLCLYVGDAMTDVECAVRAGADAALAVWNGSEAFSSKAQFVLHSPSELCTALISD